MTETKEKKNTAHGPRSQERFNREAKALQKNLQKRKKQQEARERLKEAEDNQRENQHGQD